MENSHNEITSKKKPIVYLTYEEGEKLKEEILVKNELLEKKKQEYQNEYVRLGSLDKINKKKIIHLSNKINHLVKLISQNKVTLTKIELGKMEKLDFFGKIKKYFSTMSYEKQKAMFGYLFILPWVIGFCIFFAKPVITSFYWSFFDMSLKEGGVYSYDFIWFQNYTNLFTTQTLGGKTIIELLGNSMGSILIDLPTIIILSLFLAVLLNTKFKGHKFVKAIFFIPVIYNTSIVNAVLNGAFGDMASGIEQTGFVLATKFTEFLMQIGIGNGLVEFLTSAVDRIFQIINMSGIQILIFIAALQSVPKHLYEAAIMEGATKYEMFWKITIPMVSPMILTCIVYTIVDRFGSTELMQMMTVNSQGTKLMMNTPGSFSAISIIYFMANALIIGIAFILMRRMVFYYDK